jgi:hypothetical protein
MADIIITPTNVVPPTGNATERLSPATFIAGVALLAGEVVCLDETDNKLYHADANNAARRDVKGFAGNSAVAAGQRLDVITKCPALVVGAHGVTVGTPLFLSNTAGKICPLADLGSGSLPVLVAFAQSATALEVSIAPATTPIP